MIRDGHDDLVNFFTGVEVEHTPAYGLKTLFVVGVRSFESIAEHLIGCEHIYFGANMSFPDSTGLHHWEPWEEMIRPFLDADYMCTLDIDVKWVPGLLETGFAEYNNFIPMISVKLPRIQQLGYNATIKLDDVDFDATNPGVWCHSVHSLQNRDTFTPWSKYTKDETL
tara:strand:+ start:240 stop:743 length:504 start_codon:yes stop_codon:yes gene_type:complete